MKKLMTLIALLICNTFGYATQYNINISGLTYTPSNLNALVGDTINFQASTFHPTVQVSEVTWLMNGAAPLAGGFGTQTANFSIVVSGPDDIFYVCSNHIGSGMKGRIFVSATNVPQLSINDLIIGPNPIQDRTLVIRNANQLKDQIQLNIIDIKGQVVYKGQLSNTAEQKISLDIAKGSYIYFFSSEGLISKSRQLLVVE
ncbi:MAG TPA: T9SS type A sorting domain-containing protein [Bacteroidia bacterium]|nr:T9SS type A sorting domain-containing protein [Bacteroidia bacterium]HNT81044.1 T9SS type A sorting domain-containing protein [Bacteroidia bacterium]